MSGLGKYTWAADEVYEGEFRSDLSHGFGIYWTAEGEVAKCGRWADDELVESCPVPRVKIPVGKFLSAAGERHIKADCQVAVSSTDSRHLRSSVLLTTL